MKIYMLELVLVTGKNKKSLGKSDDNWVSTIGEESIAASRGPFWLDASSSWVSATVNGSDTGVLDIRAESK